jgi:hypothetical protein
MHVDDAAREPAVISGLPCQDGMRLTELPACPGDTDVKGYEQARVIGVAPKRPAPTAPEK